MKVYANGLDTHLAGDTTSLCYCWRVERLDGQIFGFTDHDLDLVVDGTTFLATTGITTTKIVRRLGLAVDNLDLSGAIDDEAITELDIERGLYDNAAVSLYAVNWRDPTQFDKLAAGTFGNVAMAEDGFEVEFRTHAHVLNQPTGRVYQRTCEAKLGDARCTFDTSAAGFTVTATVVSADGHTVVVDAISQDDDWFSLGKLTDAGGAVHKVKLHTGTTLTLWEEPVVAIEAGSTVTIVAGCRRDAETCRVKFNNIDNYQGFGLFMPGTDRLMEYPIRGAKDYDGGSLFK